MEINLTSKELSQLRVSQYETSDKVVFVKATCILMVADGVAIDTIANFLCVDVSTVYRYFKLCIGGFEGIFGDKLCRIFWEVDK